MRRIIFLFIVLSFYSSIASAQQLTDTLRLDFKQAEKLLLENNLDLLTQKYAVDSRKALIEQAKLWDNPVLSTDQNLYDNTRKFFNHNNGNGQVYAQLSQLFKTAGKRGKEVQLAKDNSQIDEALFKDLMRNLHYNLQLDFTDLANLVEQSQIYQNEIASASNLVNIINKSYGIGNSSLKDVIRLKALLFGLQNDLVDNDRQMNLLESELKTLLATKETSFLKPEITITPKDTTLNVPNLIDQAKANRGDFLASQYLLTQSTHTLAYQKALAVPDLNVGVEYDKVNSYSPNFFGLTIGLPLPLFNHNQGNIKSARLAVKSQDYAVQNNENQLKNEVVSAVNQYQISQELLSKSSIEFYDTYDELFKNMLKSYQQRQISLIEFIDFFDSYKDTKLKVIQQKYNLEKAIADLNFSVGSTIINP